MKTGDLIFPAILALIPALVVSGGDMILEDLVREHRHWAGFLLFALLAPAGEALACRLGRQPYPRPALSLASALLWGLYGLLASVLYWVFNGGVFLAQAVDILPGGGYAQGPNLFKSFFGSFFFAGPFFTSLLVCLTLNPVFLAGHKLLLAALGFKLERGRWPSLGLASWKAQWAVFIKYQLVGTPLTRVPLMTLVFMLPQGWWLIAASLGWALVSALEGLSFRLSSNSRS